MIIIPDAIYSVQGMHSSYTYKCCVVLHLYVQVWQKNGCFILRSKGHQCVLYNSNLQQVAALRTYIYLLTTKNTRKKVLDFDALTLVNISQEVILLPGFKVQ